MIFKASPRLNIPQFINAVKTITSREIQRNIPNVKIELWKEKFWSPSYFLATSVTILFVFPMYVYLLGCLQGGILFHS